MSADPVKAAYDAWSLHVVPMDQPRCPSCWDAKAPTEGCADGRELWGTYRLAHIDRFMASKK